jgi:hypothetical protein
MVFRGRSTGRKADLWSAADRFISKWKAIEEKLKRHRIPFNDLCSPLG